MDPTLGQIHPVHILTAYFLHIISISSHKHLGYQMGHLPSSFLTFCTYFVILTCMMHGLSILLSVIQAIGYYANIKLTQNDLGKDGWTNIHENRKNLDALYPVACGGGGGGYTCFQQTD